MTGTSGIICARAVMNVLQTIESAFDHVGYPGDVNIIQCGCPICRQITEYFRGTKWQMHTLEGLRKHQLAITLFTPEAFRYFLPAFMTQSLGAWSDTCLIPFLITKQFLPLREDEATQRRHRRLPARVWRFGHRLGRRRHWSGHRSHRSGRAGASRRQALVCCYRYLIPQPTAFVSANLSGSPWRIELNALCRYRV